MPPLSRRGTEDAGDSCGMMLRGQTLKSGRRGAESGFAFYKPQALNKSFTKLWFASFSYFHKQLEWQNLLIKLLGN